ncbi:mitochondrial phosphate carrier protein, putative [Ricinus communis]|uniref:Mitochondrial phosphate carrier protein, putative n=1 Tax=Ricinus communis TaxID=3988 RepID=B9RH02_RICCO|nr:mitochondrial phosphate carrier protein, putative [Ricinus communis]
MVRAPCDAFASKPNPNPADNLVSFLNNAKGATVDSAVKKIGLRGQFRVVMIGTLTGAQWGIYDAFKASVGLSATAGGAAPAALLSL